VRLCLTAVALFMLVGLNFVLLPRIHAQQKSSIEIVQQTRTFKVWRFEEKGFTCYVVEHNDPSRSSISCVR
jgi:hypothetical protein